jgi:hypothetical protein
MCLVIGKRNAATSQVISQRSGLGCLAATSAAISPIVPVTTPPAPGTAIKPDDRSIADRMNVRSSAARFVIE